MKTVQYAVSIIVAIWVAFLTVKHRDSIYLMGLSILIVTTLMWIVIPSIHAHPLVSLGEYIYERFMRKKDADS